jgi:hypothetical protein
MPNEVSIDGLDRPSGESVKFERIGDSVVGTITQILTPHKRINKNNQREEMVYPIGITPNEVGAEQVMIWPVSVDTGPTPLFQAIIEAVRAAGCSTYTVGAKLGVKFTEEKDTGKPLKLKLFKAQYEPPASAPASVDVTKDLW